jgi:hypothetical protein
LDFLEVQEVFCKIEWCFRSFLCISFFVKMGTGIWNINAIAFIGMLPASVRRPTRPQTYNLNSTDNFAVT